MKALLTSLHNWTRSPRSGSYCGPDPGQNYSSLLKRLRRVGRIGETKAKSHGLMGPPTNTYFSQTARSL